MSLRQSKAYVGFKAFNGILFIVLGAAILFQVARVAGARLEAIPGIVLGAAMFALGAYRITMMMRYRG
jgi:predicted phage tail protein